MKKNDLFTLIKSMSKAEKRHFKLTSSKYDKGSKNNYLRLFDLIDKMDSYQEETVARKFTDINLSYTKNYLFHSLLKSLREFHSEISEDAQLKDMMRDAEILFRRGLYELCYSVLQNAKDLAIQYEKLLLLLEIIECERKVVFRLDQTEEIQRVIAKNSAHEAEVMKRYFNLSQYRELCRKMFVQSRYTPAPTTQEDLKPYKEILQDPLLQDEEKALSLEASFNYHNALSIFFHATSNWEKFYEQRKKLVDLFESRKAREILGYDGIFISLNNYVVACICYNRYEEALTALQRLKTFSSKIINFNKTHFSITFNLELSILLYLKKFTDASKAITEYLKLVNIDAPGIPSSQLRILHFSIAYVLFANGQPKEALKWLGKISADKENTARPDLIHFGTILSTIILIDIGDLDPDLIKRYIVQSKKSGNYNAFEETLFSFALEYMDAEPQKHKNLLTRLKTSLTTLFEDQMQARVLHYVDILSWIDSKIQDKPLIKVISAPQPTGEFSFFPNGFIIKPEAKKSKEPKAV